MPADPDGTTATGDGRETEEEECDRRLSRAARKLVHHHLQRVIQAENDILYHNFLDHSDVWMLLEHWLHANGRRLDQCPLNPLLDAYRIDEEHTVLVDSPTKVAGAYPTFVAQQRAKGRRKRAWFECGYSGKTFSSRYYLDAHLDRHHKLEESTFCPALDWCKAVGLANCHATALEDEPYYGQGSDGWGDDGNLLKHKWIKKAHSIACNVAAIREDCRSIMDECGVIDSSQRWCDSLVCPTHGFFASLSSNNRSRDALVDISHAGTFLVAIIFLLFYFCVYFQILDFEEQPFGRSYVSPGLGSSTSSKNTQKLVRRLDGKVRDFNVERTAEKQSKGD